MRGCSAPKACPLEGAIDIGIAAACAEGVAAMDTLVALTVEYMNTRKPFGATLASLQALRHRMADVKRQLELARSMSCFASLKLNEPAPQRRRALSQAKVQLGQSTRFIGQQCIQLHGGIGVTDEVAVSHYFTRLTMLKLAFGDTLHRLGEVSERMAGGIGAASLTGAGVTVAALMVVNATGNVVDPSDGTLIAGARLNKVQCTLLPAHTPFDGDTLFALATGTNTLAPSPACSARWPPTRPRAVLAAVRHAGTRAGVPASRELGGAAVTRASPAT